MAKVPRDVSTLSNYHQFKTTNSAVNFKIDFPRQVLTGSVTLDLETTNDEGVSFVHLDSSYLDIEDVKVNDKTSQWTLHPRVEPLGSKLEIQLESAFKRGDKFAVNIKISTTEKCTALGWLTATQARSKDPYVYSQCQAIHARSLFPCQDTPDSKSTFDFTITSPTPVIASGIPTGTKPGSQDGLTTSTFRQEVPIPSYLFAVASGDIVTANIGPRSKVATSPDFLQAAKWEFEGSTEKFMVELEKIIYPYQWGEYNLLVLPSSFPYGGMENPIYTYVTPTLISGDRENVDVVAHEFSHSYSGNLVTAATWTDFWLNEGWTMYLQRRIEAAIHGQSQFDFSAIIGWKELVDDVDRYGREHEFTKLLPDLVGKNIDDAFSRVPYEKGFLFLYYLEGVVGKPKFNKYIPHYFTKFARKSLDTQEFKADLLSFFENDAEASAALQGVDFRSWLYKPGLPPKPKFDTSLVDIVLDLVKKWERSDFRPSPTDIEGLRANQIVVFLDGLLDLSPQLSKERVQLLGDVYGFAHSKNLEVSFRFLKLGLESRLESVYGQVTDILASVGRMLYVRPLYRLLNEVDRKLALETFEKNKKSYHPICRDVVQKDLFGPKE